MKWSRRNKETRKEEKDKKIDIFKDHFLELNSVFADFHSAPTSLPYSFEALS